MHPAETSIRSDISNLTKHRIAPITEDIKRDIKYAYWHGFIDESLSKELLNLLSQKRDNVFDY